MQQQAKPIIILDANAFISSNHILNLGTTHRLVTTKDVLEELRDQKTRNMVNSLPFQIQTKQPTKESIEKVKDFARKTGDIGSLSDVDIQIIALAHTFYIREGLQDLLRKNPQQMNTIVNQIASQSQSQSSSESQEDNQNQKQIKEKNIQQSSNNSKIEQTQQKQEEDGWITVPSKQKPQSQSQDSDLDSQQGWITPQNYQQKIIQNNTINTNDKTRNSNDNNEQEENKQNLKITLMSADYAVQNVATQMGIRLLSLDGRKISSIRRFVWECYLCWKQYKITQNKVKLCSNCGYNTLSKIAYSITADGKMIMHRKKGWKPNQKVLQWKQKKFLQQQKKRKHQHPRKKKGVSIFDTA